ncbi:MAG: DUF2249 domain-containing protein [Thermoleophilia bacterium]|nr:DUF2249 domain-containing protein [Thermoleophilia bacterium]
MSQAVVIDVREIVPRERHPLIFSTLDDLPSGGVLEIVNDHDPAPLRYQLEATRPDAFAWEYLEQGPEVWRVHITRR